MGLFLQGEAERQILQKALWCTDLYVLIFDSIHNDSFNLTEIHEWYQLLQAVNLHDRVNLA